MTVTPTPNGSVPHCFGSNSPGPSPVPLPALLPEARDLLTAFSYIAIDDEVVDGAMSEPDRGLRSLDTIHLATARILAPELEALVTYDDRLVKAAADAGLATVSPGTETA